MKSLLVLFLSTFFCMSMTQAPLWPERGIYIIGVTHAPTQFYSGTMSPAHIREFLKALNPDVVGVESNPTWFNKGQYYLATYEAQNITVPWAKERKLPVYGIDWITDKNSSVNTLSDSHSELLRLQRVRQIQKEKEKPKLKAVNYQYGLWSKLKTPSPNSDTFRKLNSMEFGKKVIQWIDKDKNTPGTASAYMNVRDSRITDHIEALVKKHPQAKIVIVIGAMHKLDVERRLKKLKFNVKSLTMLFKRLPVDEAETMDTYLIPQDIISILSEVFDSKYKVSFSSKRLEKLLVYLKEKSSSQEEIVWNHYFQARYYILKGEYEKAEQLLLQVVEKGKGLIYPYRGYRWRQYLSLQQAAWLDLGRLTDVKGKRTQARNYYQKILDSLNVPNYSEDYHSNFEYLARAYNAIRALLTSPFKDNYQGVQTQVDSSISIRNRDKVYDLYKKGKYQQALSLLNQREETGSSQLMKVWIYYRLMRFKEGLEILNNLFKTKTISQLERSEGALLEIYFLQKLKEPGAVKSKIKAFQQKHLPHVPKDHWIRREYSKIQL